jgi:hypothetical protein
VKLFLINSIQKKFTRAFIALCRKSGNANKKLTFCQNFLLLFNSKTADNTVIIAKGRIIHDGNSGIEGDGVGEGTGVGVNVGIGDYEGLGEGTVKGIGKGVTVGDGFDDGFVIMSKMAVTLLPCL